MGHRSDQRAGLRKEDAVRILGKSTVARGAGLIISVASVAVLAVTAIGTGSAVASSPTPPTTTSPPSTNTVVLTNASNGTSVVVSKGTLVVVRLAGNHLQWSQAQVIESTPVLVRVSGGTTTTTGASTTVFRATGYGTATLDATGSPFCGTSGGCPEFVVLWHAGVVVPVKDPPPPTAA
jgi:hypothetical protein